MSAHAWVATAPTTAVFAVVGCGIVQIPRHDAGSEAKAVPLRSTARRARGTTPAAIERFGRGLGSLGFPALIRNPCLHAGIQIGEQRQRIGPIAAYECASPCAEPIGQITVVRSSIRPRSMRSSAE
jgi:hypothetical protein